MADMTASERRRDCAGRVALTIFRALHIDADDDAREFAVDRIATAIRQAERAAYAKGAAEEREACLEIVGDKIFNVDAAVAHGAVPERCTAAAVALEEVHAAIRARGGEKGQTDAGLDDRDHRGGVDRSDRGPRDSEHEEESVT